MNDENYYRQGLKMRFRIFSLLKTQRYHRQLSWGVDCRLHTHFFTKSNGYFPLQNIQSKITIDVEVLNVLFVGVA